MDWKIVIGYLFNSIPFEFYVSFYIFAIIGMTFSMLVHFQQLKKKNKRIQKKIKFDFKYWLKNNVVRMLTNLIAIFIFIRFKDNLNVGIELSMFLAFVIGLSIDRAVLIIKNLKLGTTTELQ
jgi:C4-dicarboxylate transporter